MKAEQLKGKIKSLEREILVYTICIDCIGQEFNKIN